MCTEPVGAATAKRYRLPASEVPTFKAWTRYLSSGPTVWNRSTAPSFTPAIRGTIWQVLKTDTQAQALANPMIDYLLWRRSLNPVRFASYHPRLSPALSQLLTISTPSLPSSVPPPSFTPVPQVVTPTSPQGVTPPLIPPAPQGVSPAAIPEPSSILLAIGMTAVGVWWRGRLAHSS